MSDIIETEADARETAWHDAYTDARADGANHNDAEECADRYVRDLFDKPRCSNCGDNGCPNCSLPCMACESFGCNGRCIE